MLISWLINAVALAAAAYLVPGIDLVGEPAWVTVAVMAVIFGLVNALIRPFFKLMSCPLILLTLGLFSLVINGLMLWLSSWIGEQFGVGFRVAGLWPAFWGALVIAVVSFVLTVVFGGGRERHKKSEWRTDRR